jgi:cytochrome c oxidase subunit 2
MGDRAGNGEAVSCPGSPRRLRSRSVPGSSTPPPDRGPLGRRRAAPVVGTLALAVVVLAGCSGDLGAPAAATEQADGFTSLWRIFLPLAVGVAGLIWVLVAWSIIRYRRRADDAVPSQRQYNIPLEVSYIVAPLVLVAVLFGLTLAATDRFTSLADEPDVTVKVIGFQWQWQFQYLDDEGQPEVIVSGSDQAQPELVLPVGSTVRFELVSNDVNHSFWVPEFLEKRDLIPGVDNEIDVNVLAPGEWRGRCAEYCGLDHWTMAFDVRAVPADEFDDWLDQARSQPQPMVAGAATEEATG